MKKKTFVLLLALVLIAGAAVGGTLAWLTDTTDEVTNTFTTSDIKITLAESENLKLQMVPGYTIAKDPKVTVLKDSEKCYLFVKIEELNSFSSFMTYTVADGWTQLKDASDNDVPGVYYRVVDASTTDQEFAVLKDNQVTVKDTVTKEMMNSFDADKNGVLSADEKATLPTLTFTAYASQYMKNNTEFFTAAEAWKNVNPTT